MNCKSIYTFNIKNSLTISSLNISTFGELFKIENKFTLSDVILTTPTRAIYSTSANLINILNSSFIRYRPKHAYDEEDVLPLIDVSNIKDTVTIDSCKVNGFENAVQVSNTNELNFTKTNITNANNGLILIYVVLSYII